MTKERLYYESDEDYRLMLDIFFDSNVCIPKGQQRHPDADVLHELFEDMDKKGEVSYIGTSLGWSGFDSYRDYKFRIKPSEPVYEYRMLLLQLTGDYVLSEWMTFDEFNSSTLSGTVLKETKRVRQ